MESSVTVEFSKGSFPFHNNVQMKKPSAAGSAMAGMFRFCEISLAAGSLFDGHGNSRRTDEGRDDVGRGGAAVHG